MFVTHRKAGNRREGERERENKIKIKSVDLSPNIT